MKQLTLEDIKVWPKKVSFTEYGFDLDKDITYHLTLINEKYMSDRKNSTIHDKTTVLKWINAKELDRQLFYKAIFDEEMKEIINSSPSEKAT